MVAGSPMDTMMPQIPKIQQVLLDALPALIFMVDTTGALRWANESFHEYVKKPGGSVPKNHISDFFPGSEYGGATDYAEVIASGKPKRGIVQPVTLPLSGTRTLKLDYLPVTAESGEITGVIGFGLDITEQVQMREIKQHVYQQLEKNMEQFAILGDELRNPLTVIIGLADLIDDTSLAQKVIANAKEIDSIITKIDHGWIESEKVREFMKKYYDIGIRGTHELVARAIHEEDVARQAALGISSDKNPSLLPWNELPQALRETNLQQAEDIAKKLLLINCGIGIAIRDVKPVFTFTDEEVEQLAEEEHARWMKEKGGRSWTHGLTRLDPDHVHNGLVPWNKLTEAEKEKDRHAVRALPAILAKVHLKVFRLRLSEG